MAHEVFEEGEFTRLEVNFLAGAGDFAGKEVQFQIAASQSAWLGGLGGAADEGLEAGGKLGKGEGLGQVIVGPGFQTLDAVVHGGLGAEDDDGSADFFGAEAMDQAEAVELGQHDVHHGGVIGGGFGKDKALLAVGAAVHGVAGLLESFDNKGSNFVVVLDDQYAHDIFDHKSNGGGSRGIAHNDTGPSGAFIFLGGHLRFLTLNLNLILILIPPSCIGRLRLRLGLRLRLRGEPPKKDPPAFPTMREGLHDSAGKKINWPCFHPRSDNGCRWRSRRGGG